MDGPNQVLGCPAGQDRCCAEARRLIYDVTDHVVLVEEDVPLHGVIELGGQPSWCKRLRSGSRPASADSTSVDNVLDEVQREIKNPRRLRQLPHPGRRGVPEPDVQPSKCHLHRALVP